MITMIERVLELGSILLMDSILLFEHGLKALTITLSLLRCLLETGLIVCKLLVTLSELVMGLFQELILVEVLLFGVLGLMVQLLAQGFNVAFRGEQKLFQLRLLAESFFEGAFSAGELGLQTGDGGLQVGVGLVCGRGRCGGHSVVRKAAGRCEMQRRWTGGRTRVEAYRREEIVQSSL